MLSHEKIYSNIYKNVRGELTFVIYCMFCSIKFIFIYKNLSLHWRVTFSNVLLPKHPVESHAESHINLQKYSFINVYENTIVMHGTLDKLLLNATAVSDFKKALPKKHTMQ